MKKIFITLLLFPVGFLHSQDFDEAYLNSLPDSIRKDVIERMADRDESDENPTYRNRSSMVEKSEEENEEEDENVIERFGKSFFETVQSSFMPINEPNLNSSYVLDFGDELEVQIIGQINLTESLSIERDGSINIPDIGKVFISGLSISDASALIKNKVQNAYIGSESFITLKDIRDINVLIAGNAFSPGIYTLNGNSSMLHALSMAGGIDDIGSYRDISLVRDGEIIDSLDIYEVLIFGRHNLSKGLRSGDSIVVNPLLNIVSIESGVLRPGNYELKDDESVEDLIYFANGFNKEADKKNIILKRLSEDKIASIELNHDSLDSTLIKNGDSVYVKENKINTVYVEGAVINPGKYFVPIGIKLSELINIAGGYDSTAYPFAGYLENKKALEINSAAKERLYDAFLNNLIANASSLAGNQDPNIGLILEQIQNSEATGRIIAEFDLDIIKSNPSLDTALEDGDRIIIPNITQQVYIQGEISNPGAVRYEPEKGIEFYIKNAGGTLNNADMKNIFIVHPNGETENLSSNKRPLSFIVAKNTKQLVYPGSIIYIPQSTDLTNSLQVASIWAPIISSIALSITSLSVLNNN